MEFVGALTLVCAALFTGAAVYISVAEHPAREGLSDGPMLAQWKPSYTRGFQMQASLALIGALLGVWASYATGDWRWLAGALLLGSNWPFTLFAILPINKQLEAMPVDAPGPELRKLMNRWGQLHSVRSALGALATLVFFWAAIS